MTDNQNLALWNKVSRVPKEHLKGFTRGGGFKGTAIKPMWSIHTMTEQFGPCGEGWGIGKPDFTVVPSENETLVYCTVSVWHGKPSNLVYGVGGDKVRAQFSSGPKNDDEAFKKAFTDAITNALKHIGVGADIHMGLWDGNKYVDETPEDAPQRPIDPRTPINSNGTPAQPLKRDEARALFKTLKGLLVTCNTDGEVMQFEHDNGPQIELLGDWKVHIDNAITQHRAAIADAQGKAA